MPNLILKRVIVRGFGPYADQAQVELFPATNILVAPNEAGKSTLAAAIAATLYGLPATVDPERFGQGRYRHWGQALRFEGELDLTVDGVEYHLSRQFETHKVTLRCQEEGRWRLVIDGVVDNPESRRPNPQYRRFLQETVGLENRELFAATFFLAQPLPNEVELDGAVQQLLSGTGSRYDQVSKGLEAKVKELTRLYGAALGDKGKGHKDRPLEQIVHEMMELEQRIATGRVQADGLQAVQQQLVETRQQVVAMQERLARREELAKAWTQWRTERERHQAALHGYQELEQALGTAQALGARLDATKAQISQEHGEMHAYGPGLAPQLDELERIQQLAKAVDTERSVMQTDLQATMTSLGSVEQELQTFPLVLHSPSVAVDHARMVELDRTLGCWQADCQAWRSALADIEGEIKSLPEFTNLSQNPVAVLSNLTRWCEDVSAVIGRWQKRRHELHELDDLIERQYGVLVNANPELLAQAANYPLKQMELDKAEQETCRAHEQLERDEEAYQLAKQAFVRRFGSPTTGFAELLADVRDKLRELHGLTQDKAEQGGKKSPLWLRAIGGWLLGLTLGGVSAWWIDGPLRWGVVGFLALVVGGGCHWWFNRAGVGGGTHSTDGRKGSADLDRRLGPLAGLEFGELTDARALLEQLAFLSERRPDASLLRSMQQEREQARADMSEWQALVRPLNNAYTNPQAAFNEWQGLEQRRALLKQEMQLLSEQLGCQELGSARALSALLDQPYLNEALTLLDLRLGTMDDLVLWLQDGSERWQALVGQATRWEKLHQERRRLVNQLALAEQQDSDGLTAGERLAREAGELRQRLQPYTEATSKEELQRELERYRELAQKVEKLRAQAEEQTKRFGEKDRQARELQGQWEDALQPIASLWGEANQELAQLKRRYRDYTNLVQQEAQLRQGMQAVLQARQVTSLPELERLKMDQGLGVVAIKSRWQALIDQYPGLPTQEEANHSQTVADHHQNLTDELTSLREQIESLRHSEDELRDQQSALQGQNPINIAVAEDDLQALRNRHQQLSREVQALGLAYRELKAAIVEYEGSYRGRLEEQASAYFRQITGDDTRVVELSPEFAVGLSTADGRRIVPRQLSQGARDQLYISLRLAIADLMADNMTLPLILDDPFVNCDQERLDRIRATLQEISGGRQILLLTHQKDLGAWGSEVVVRR